MHQTLMCENSSMAKFTAVLLIVIVLLCLATTGESAKVGRGSGRRRGTKKRFGSPRFIFYTHPKRKDYYDNPDGAQIIKASHFDYEYLLGHKIVFICEARGKPQPRINWFKDGIELYSHPYMQITEWQLNLDHIKSKLEITPARQMDSGTYECQANNKYSLDARTFKADFSTISK